MGGGINKDSRPEYLRLTHLFVPPEVITKRGKHNVRAVQLCFLPVLIEESFGAFLYVAVSDLSWWDVPRAEHTATRQPLEVELTTHLRVGSTRVRNIVTVEWLNVNL